MSSELQLLADIKAELADLSARVSALSAVPSAAPQPNAKELADAIDAHLRRGIQGLQEDFSGKFAGLISPFLKDTRAEVEKLAAEQIALEGRLAQHRQQYGEMLEEHRKEVSKLYTAHVNSIKKLLASNAKTLDEQTAVVNKTLEVAAEFDQHFVELHNGHLALLQSSEQTVAKAEVAVERFDQISTGTLKEVATEARQSIKRLSRDAETHIVTTRRRFIKVMSGFDDKVSQFPVMALVMIIATITFGFGLLGNVVGRRIVKDNAQEMIAESVAKAQEAINQRIDPKIEALEKLERSLGLTFDDAQMWDALTANMSYEEKLVYIRKAQAEIQRRGQTLRSTRE
jgi:hypothetical protein